jgi:hypothetical protein
LASTPLSEMIAPIILEADGTLVPLQHAFSRFYVIGNIRSSLIEAEIQQWKMEKFSDLLSLCRKVHRQVIQQTPPELPFLNWYSEILQES